jgi:Cu2+-exporting ATPase
MAEPALSDRNADRGAQTVAAQPPARYAPFVKQDDKGRNRLTLGVQGVRCANCIQKIESALSRDPEMVEARVNFSTKRLNLVWHGDAAKADGIASEVEALGYPVSAYDAGDSAAQDDKEEKFLLLCMAISGFATGNIMLLSLALWTTTTAEMGFFTRELFHWISALIAIPAGLYSAQPFFRSAWRALKMGGTNMDVPISVGVVLTLVVSVMQTVRGNEHAYFDSVTMLVFFLLIGRYLDHRARRHARRAAGDLLALMAGTATIEAEDGTRKIIPIKDIKENMVLHVAVGERVPADAIIISGTSSIDTSLVTGESLPVQANAGDSIFSGSLNLSAPLVLRVAKAAEDSLLADIIRLMEKAEQGQALYVRIADRMARLYTPVVHLLALVTFLGWILLGSMGWEPALMIAVTVLIITCPCALGLAVPVVQVLGTSLLMKKGVMVKAGDAFERLAMVDTLLFDKTGTLTLGRPELLNIDSIAPGDLRLAAALAQNSKHPLSLAVLRAYNHKTVMHGELPVLRDITEHAGQGVQGYYGEDVVRLGSRAWCGDMSASADTQLELWLQVGSRKPVRFMLADVLREDSKQVIEALQQRGMKLVMLSGDRAEVVAQVAAELGIEAHAALKPADKYAFMEQLKAQGHKVAMVGDGLNDAPVLSGADVSLSPASAIDLAQNAADIVFMGDKLGPLLVALDVAKRTQKLVRENFALAAIYNIVAVPLAMAGYVTPLVAALAMSGSSIVVIANSFRVRQGQ